MSPSPSDPVPDTTAPPAETAGEEDALLAWDGPAKLPAAEPVDGDGAVASEAPAAPPCPSCQAPRTGSEEYCGDCGWVFASAPVPTNPAGDLPPPSATRITERYELGERLGKRGRVERYRGRGFITTADEPVPIVLLRAPAPALAEAVPLAETESENAVGDQDVAFDEAVTASLSGDEALYPEAIWPSLAWEHARLEKATHPSLPRVLDRFTADGFEYLVEEVPQGRSLWDAWDDPEATNDQRFGWLQQLAEALQDLHQAGAILEALRPEIVIVTPTGQARLTDLSDLLPLPVPADAPIRATFYTAPELVLSPQQADARADLYTFGALLYALNMGRELSEPDFERPGFPKAFIPLFPDAHPLLARLVSKTFCRDLGQRFPTDEAGRTDPTGFRELIQTLETCRRVLDRVRLEIAAWSTIGMVRTGNEDAFALLHRIEGREDDVGESALILLADGMGGYDAGEIAAALAIQGLRRTLLEQRPFAAVAGNSAFWPEGPREEPTLDVARCKQFLAAALQEANKLVHDAAKSGIGRRGMGCTAEVVFVHGRHVIVGHVGDSRTYHLQRGRLVQLTRDDTLVNRLVELGHLTEEEATRHPRRSELQQAVGGYTTVEPSTYSSTLQPGDWVVVCSDGLSNHIYGEQLTDMLQTATSAEMAARRLVNLVNLEGALDNATVVVVRVT
jgi:serine/threonine protein phosphatase PrpC